jgi:hypothetical protein
MEEAWPLLEMLEEQIPPPGKKAKEMIQKKELCFQKQIGTK